MLLLVLDDHAVGEAAGDQARPAEAGHLQQVEDPAADVGGVAAGLARRQQRQRRPLRARMLERVVERVDLRVDRVLAADRAQQPHLLLVGDVRQIPDQRRHQRRMLPGQVGLVHALRQRDGAVPGGGQGGSDLAAQGFRAWGFRAWGFRAWGFRAWGLRAWGLRAWGFRAGGLRAGGLRAERNLVRGSGCG